MVITEELYRLTDAFAHNNLEYAVFASFESTNSKMVNS